MKDLRAEEKKRDSEEFRTAFTDSIKPARDLIEEVFARLKWGGEKLQVIE